MHITFNTRELILAFGIFISLGCVNYQYYDPTPVGIFYPQVPGTVRVRDASGKPNGKSFLGPSVTFTISQPVQIVALGLATYYDENAGTHEVAKLKFSDGEYFVWTDSLKQFGRIEIKGNQGTWGLLSPIPNFPNYLFSGLFTFILLIGMFSTAGLAWRALWSFWL